MVIERRALDQLGVTHTPHLTVQHHFCFGAYAHPERERWGGLRGLNNNSFAVGASGSPQLHDDIDVITWVRRGVIERSGNLGSGHRLTAGNVQLLSSGSGIADLIVSVGFKPAEFIEIWLPYDQPDETPRRMTTRFPTLDQKKKVAILASGLPEDSGAMPLRSASRVVGVRLTVGARFRYSLAPRRYAYILAASGVIEVGATRIGRGEAAAVRDETSLDIIAVKGAEIVIIDVRAATEAQL